MVSIKKAFNLKQKYLLVGRDKKFRQTWLICDYDYTDQGIKRDQTQQISILEEKNQ